MPLCRKPLQCCLSLQSATDSNQKVFGLMLKKCDLRLFSQSKCCFVINNNLFCFSCRFSFFFLANPSLSPLFLHPDKVAQSDTLDSITVGGCTKSPGSLGVISNRNKTTIFVVLLQSLISRLCLQQHTKSEEKSLE